MLYNIFLLKHSQVVMNPYRRAFGKRCRLQYTCNTVIHGKEGESKNVCGSSSKLETFCAALNLHFTLGTILATLHDLGNKSQKLSEEVPANTRNNTQNMNRIFFACYYKLIAARIDLI